MTSQAGRMVPPEHMRNHSADEYLRSAEHTIGFIHSLVPITPETRVLDVGCAAGRLALPLIGHVASYDGFDVKADRIAWAQDNIPGGRFRHIDVHSEGLNPEGTVDGATLRFPYPDESFELVIFHSVFTHLLPREGANYLRESARCLARDGRIYSTWYLWDDWTALSVAGHDVLWDFPLPRDGYRIQRPHRPEAAVAYEYDHLAGLLRDAGLVIDTERRGNWRERLTHDQDTLILRRAQ